MSSGEVDSARCLEAQADEIEVLYSIYGDEWKTESESDRSYSIEIKQENLSVILYVTLPNTYPFESPPQYTISAPGMKGEHKTQLRNLLEEAYLQNIGQTVLFQWIDKIREYLLSLVSSSENISKDSVPERIKVKEDLNCDSSFQTPEILHGDIIIDRKSIFQGHAATVISINQVREVLTELKKNKKIANATHNMYAYRIKQLNGTFFQDCDDDGETHAGSRLMHLLQILDVTNVLVVVTRWYGGIHLGAHRFRHINNAARQVLEKANIIKDQQK